MKTTNPELNRNMIYSVFVRNHTKEGTFKALEQDLERIKKLGTDILWLMPLYPVGEKERKGKDGSPYAIADYEKTAPEMGTMEDFESLVRTARSLGMKVIIDIVFNHTSPDSKLWKTNPEWFYRNEKGKPSSLVEEWYDIIDLDFSKPGLSDELLRILSGWALRCDGFRCDVASRIPMDFWKKARQDADSKNPDLFWLAESCHLPFIKQIRDSGRTASSDSELYEVFDAEYDYDLWHAYAAYLTGKQPLSSWMYELERQEAVYPLNYIKMRCLENHDNERFASYIKKEQDWKNFTAMLFMLKGMPLIYHGQEYSNTHRPSIFDQDLVKPEGKDRSGYIARLAKIHKEILPAAGAVHFAADDKTDAAFIVRKPYASIFALKQKAEQIPVPYEDGRYVNLMDEKPFEIRKGMVSADHLPAIFEYNGTMKDFEKREK